MDLDRIKPPLPVPTGRRRPDANGKPGGNPRRDGEPARQERQDQPRTFRNDLGQLTGKTIDITA